MAPKKRSRLATVLIPLAAGGLVLAIALPGGPRGPRHPLAVDEWPGFEGGSCAIPNLAGLMLKLHLERRDQRLELRLDNSAGLGFNWPVGDLYTNRDQHWVGLLEPGDWRLAVRTPDEPRPIAERRFSLAAGRNHGIALDLRGLSADPAAEFAVDIVIDGDGPGETAIAALDNLFEARRRGDPDMKGTALAPVQSGDQWALRRAVEPGEYVLSMPKLGVEAVLFAGPSQGVHTLVLEGASVALTLIDPDGQPYPAGTQVWWNAAPTVSAPTLMWRAREAVLTDGPLLLDTIAGELRVVVSAAGERALSARTSVRPGTSNIELAVAPRVTSRRP